MAEFKTPTDIGNRALQHCGAPQLDAILGFNEASKRAREISLAYGKLRRSELRRNIWRFATRKAALRAVDTNTLLLAPSLWVSTTTYFVGSVVADAANNLWISRIPSNLGNPPTTAASATSTPNWQPYFGPLTVSLYDPTTTYFSGELVYTAAGDGTCRVYLSLISANADNPATATAWSATTTYGQNQVVTFSAVAYMSLIALNINQEPDLAPALWAVGTTYAAGNKVGGSDGVIYQSIGSGNVGHDPTLDSIHTFWTNTGVLNPWTTVFTGGTGSLNWLEIGGAEFSNGVGLTALNSDIYPLGSGPSSQSSTRNIYRLPSGFLREAPQDPKAGSTSFLGAPSGLDYNQSNLEGNYIISPFNDVIVYRFIADVTDVSQFDDMFCECLAGRLGMEVCESITQSSAKVETCRRAWLKAEADAININGIEIGAIEPPEDSYLTDRL